MCGEPLNRRQPYDDEFVHIRLDIARHSRADRRALRFDDRGGFSRFGLTRRVGLGFVALKAKRDHAKSVAGAP